MASPFRTAGMAQPASASLTPQDITVAVNTDPQAVLQYIVSLENEVIRLQNHLVASREEMYTVIQISMSAVASEMSKTLNVTKNSLIGIQEKFHRIAASRSDLVGAVRPGVLRQYQQGSPGPQIAGNGAIPTSANFLGIGREDQKMDLLTAEDSPQYARMSQPPLNPTPRAAAHYTPTKNALGPGTLLDLSRTQENAVFPSTAANLTPQFATTSSIFEVSPTRSNVPFPRSFAVKPPMSANVKIAAPALTVRSDSQKNVQKQESSNEAFIVSYHSFSTLLSQLILSRHSWPTATRFHAIIEAHLNQSPKQQLLSLRLHHLKQSLPTITRLICPSLPDQLDDLSSSMILAS